MKRELLNKLFPKKASDYQMTLGSLTKALRKERSSLPVVISGHAELSPGIPHSYYSKPNELAFTPTDTPISVAKFIEVCESCFNSIGEKPWHQEGVSNAEWILIDYVNIVVHIFHREKRDFYNLESLWADAPIEEFENVL